MIKVLIVEDDPLYLAEMKAEVLATTPHPVDIKTACDVAAAVALLTRFRPDLALLDMVFPLEKGRAPSEEAGRKVLDRLRATCPETRAVALSGQNRDFAVKLLLESRIDDFIFKDSPWEEIRLRVHGHINQVASAHEGQLLREHVAAERGSPGPKVADPAMKAVLKTLQTVAATDSTVMLLGESGTGKEVLARHLHETSRRHGSPFVAVNCGALDENLVGSELFGHAKGSFTGAVADRKGRFEMAHGGTLFLDEIGELTLANQVRLLRVLEHRVVERVGTTQPIECDVRLVTATHRDLEEMVGRGAFREDLFFRLQVFAIRIPALRERPSDIEMLARHFVGVHASKLGKHLVGVDPEAMAILAAYRWPGNVRQLKNVIEHAAILETTDYIQPESLPPLPGMARPGTTPGDDPSFRPGQSLMDAMTDFERRLYKQALAQFRGDTVKVAQALSVPLRTLQRRLKTVGLLSREFKE